MNRLDLSGMPSDEEIEAVIHEYDNYNDTRIISDHILVNFPAYPFLDRVNPSVDFGDRSKQLIIPFSLILGIIILRHFWLAGWKKFAN